MKTLNLADAEVSRAFVEFDPQTVLRDWGNGQAFRLSDALTGVCVFGATGSGKTSGPAKHLAYGYLAADFGGLVVRQMEGEKAMGMRCSIAFLAVAPSPAGARIILSTRL